MNRVDRTLASISASNRSFVRDPFTVVFLVVLPALSTQIYGISMAQFPDVGIFQIAGSLAQAGRITGAVFATGSLAGVLGLFQMISARSADRRLFICGYEAGDLLVTRFVTVALASVLVGAVSTVSLLILLSDPVGAPLLVFGGLVLAGVIYGLLGILVGSVLPRELEGSLFLVILADVDNVFASGLFAIDQGITRFAPLSHPHAIVTQAVVDGTLAVERLLPALGHVSLFAVLAVIAYTLQVDVGGES